MTPKEKARELVVKMQLQKMPIMFEQAKQCALKSVDEIIAANPYKWVKHEIFIEEHLISNLPYWLEVRKEIEKL